jgi:hypothetical protein
MGNIPEFTRTVLPQNAQYGLVDVARQKGASEAGQFRQNAQNMATTQAYSEQTTHTLNMVKLREAEAENMTWVNENTIQYKKDLAEKLDAQRQSRSSNPGNFHKDFDKEMDNLSREYIKKAPSEAARIALKQSSANIRSSYYDDNLNWERQRKVSMFGESMERSASNLGVLAYRAGQDGKDLEQSGVMNDVEASVVAGSSFVAADKLGGIKDGMSKTVVTNYMEGLFEKNPAKAKEILNSRKYDKVLGADVLQRFDSKIKAQERIEVSGEADDVEQAAKLGIEVPTDKLQSLIGKLEGAGMQDQAQRFRDFSETQTATVAFAKKPLTEQVSEMNTMKKSLEAGNLTDVKKYAAMADVFQAKQEAIKKDPWTFYAARNIVADPNPLDFSNPQSMGKELDSRRLAAQQIKDLDGINVPLFTGAEVDSLKRVYETAKPEELSAIMSSMGNALKPNEQASLAQAMAPKSAELAVAIATGDPAVGEKIIMGSQIEGLVAKKDVMSEVMTQLQDVVTDPVRLDKIQSAVYSYYKVLQYQSKDNNTAVNSEYVTKAITDIMGPVANVDTKSGWGGTSKVLSYKDKMTGTYVDEDSLQNTLSSLTDDRIKLLNGGSLPVGTSGAKFSAKDIYRSGRFVSDGDGLYAIIDEQGEPIGNEDGSIFRVDARKLAEMAKGGK